MNGHDAIKLTTYFGERDRANGAFLSDALIDVYERHCLQASVLLRGAEGFGLKHHLHTQRLLTLSEDLPVVSVAVDTRERIGAALPEVTALASDGLVTLERARMLSPSAAGLPGQAKLTIYCGRRDRIDGRPAFVAIVDLLRAHGVDGATVLLGVDGTARGTRERGRFFARNDQVPLMVISVGAGERIQAALAELDDPLATIERVTVCKRDGRLLSQPDIPAGTRMLQKLTVFSSDHALYLELIRRLRAAGAAGATALRGIWGYHGDHAPHGDRLLALRRHVPVVTVIVDDPESTRRWFPIVDELTAETGLVTSELVPAARATSDGEPRGTLDLGG